MGAVAILSVCLFVGSVSAFPAGSAEQDYLDFLAEMAAAKGRDLLSGIGNGYYDEYYPDYPRQDNQMSIEQQMLDGARQPGAELLEEEEMVFRGRLMEAPEWNVTAEIGQVGGVAVCPQGYPHVFHRGARKWQQDSFDENNVFTEQKEAIKEDPVLTLDPETGAVKDSWGAGKFYMPHGMTIDSQGNMWLTDVATHQVYKYSPEKKLLMELGELFTPAKDNTDPERFCKPTQVAVAKDGSFFVADGYCNQRVVKFSPEGKYLGQFGDNDNLLVPHSITILEKFDAVCVADRENQRIVCYDAGLKDEGDFGERLRAYTDSSMGRVFSLAFDEQDELLYGLGMGDEEFMEDEGPHGFTIDVNEEQSYYTDIITSWAPQQGFKSPHSLAISPNGEALYVGELENLQHTSLVWKFEKEEQPHDEVEQPPPADNEAEDEEEEEEEDAAEEELEEEAAEEEDQKVEEKEEEKA